MNLTYSNFLRKEAGEGGCGVIGVACEEKIGGRHLLPALDQMCNRGNGKGGGIAAVGLSANACKTTQEILDTHYLLAIAYLDLSVKEELEKECIYNTFDVAHVFPFPHLDNYKVLKQIDIPPPFPILYFVRVKKSLISLFRKDHELSILTDEAIEDEIVYQNSYQLNCKFYAATGEKKAFVLSHGKNLLVLKMVGYADDVIRYYQLENFEAHVWIGHHRYPTKGRVWHPGGAHPFVGLNEALVHNGDFANYYSLCEYLLQRHIYPHFLTDTEVAVLIFDLLHRIYQYPLEYVIEALAPTTERDFTLLPEAKQKIYEVLQKTHMHSSPDGPWFFLIAQSLQKAHRLIGITDTSMLRPQVFALQTGPAAIGFAASEKQAINAVLKSLREEDFRFWSCADFYWNARGGSYTDGGAFSFTVYPEENGKSKLVCTDKFGQKVHMQTLSSSDLHKIPVSYEKFPDIPEPELLQWMKQQILSWNYSELEGVLFTLERSCHTDLDRKRAIALMTHLMDQNYPTGQMRRSSMLAIFQEHLNHFLEMINHQKSDAYSYLSYEWEPISFEHEGKILVVNAHGFPSEGKKSLALAIVDMYRKGFREFIIFNCEGQRFIANGFGPSTETVVIHVYGSSGDYLASGIDGAKVHVHGSGQDQLAQIMKFGELIVHGDVGQAFMYGAKGGKAFIKGNTAGRPLINAVGKPKVVINGTSLDYLAESFMAGSPEEGGGFVVLNGIAFNEQGDLIELPTPYPGNNLFSLASGGAVYVRDPTKKIVKEQLNGGEFADFTRADWDLIHPFLEENAQYFNIPVKRLLEYDLRPLKFYEVYRKIHPSHVRVLQEEEAWVKGG